MIGGYTEEELQAAWGILHAAGIDEIAHISRSELGRMIRGSPPHDPARYSNAEQRMAVGLVVLRAELETHDPPTAPTA